MATNTKLSKVVIIVTMSVVRWTNLKKVLLNQQIKPLPKKRKIAEKSKEDAILD